MRTFRAVLIDPERCTVEVHSISGTHEATAELLRCGSLDHFRIADHKDSWDYGWVDDRGLARGLPIAAFKFAGNRDPVAGRCLVIGVNKKTGETVDAEFPLDVLRDVVEWLGTIRPEVTWDKHDNIERAIITYSRVKA
jgi:hypothetical protein